MRGMNTRERIMANTPSISVNISSLVVAALPAQTALVKQGLADFPGVEVHAVSDDGRMVVTIEAAGDEETVACFERIRVLPGVLSASMVYHRFEPEPDEEA